MENFHINKGIGRTVEFKGLKAQYLFIFAGGLLGVLILVTVLYLAGINSYVCIASGGSLGGGITWQTFKLNKKYGEHGLMKLGARKKHPDYIICRKQIYRYLKTSAR